MLPARVAQVVGDEFGCGPMKSRLRYDRLLSSHQCSTAAHRATIRRMRAGLSSTSTCRNPLEAGSEQRGRSALPRVSVALLVAPRRACRGLAMQPGRPAHRRAALFCKPSRTAGLSGARNWWSMAKPDRMARMCYTKEQADVSTAFLTTIDRPNITTTTQRTQRIKSLSVCAASSWCKPCASRRLGRFVGDLQPAAGCLAARRRARGRRRGGLRL